MNRRTLIRQAGAAAAAALSITGVEETASAQVRPVKTIRYLTEHRDMEVQFLTDYPNAHPQLIDLTKVHIAKLDELLKELNA